MISREDKQDLEAYYQAMEKFKKDPITYTLEEVERELSLMQDSSSETD